MQKKVSIMGVDVTVTDESSFVSKIDEYLLDDALDTVLFTSMSGLLQASEDEKLCENLNSFDIVLPGERAILEIAGEDTKNDRTVRNFSALGTVLENLWKNNRTIFIIGKNENEIGYLMKYCKKMQPELEVLGSYSFDKELTPEAVVNKINSYVPDMLLIMLDCQEQSQWIADNRQLLNAKLAVAVGSVADLIMDQVGKVPPFWETIHCGWFYRIFVQKNVHEGVNRRIFKNRFEQYNKMRSEEKESEG